MRLIGWALMQFNVYRLDWSGTARCQQREVGQFTESGGGLPEERTSLPPLTYHPSSNT